VSSCSNRKRLSLKASSYIVQLLKSFTSLHSVSNLCQFIQFGEFECYVLCQIYGADSDVSGNTGVTPCILVDNFKLNSASIFRDKVVFIVRLNI
jgi:hypothetical protein